MYMCMCICARMCMHIYMCMHAYTCVYVYAYRIESTPSIYDLPQLVYVDNVYFVYFVISQTHFDDTMPPRKLVNFLPPHALPPFGWLLRKRSRMTLVEVS